MRITTLGTSHGNHTYCRYNTSTLVEVGDASYLIDAGAPANASMVRGGQRIQNLRGVFLTHMHEDHAGGLPGVIKSLLKAPDPGQRTDVYLPEVEARAGLEAWLTAIRMRWPSPLVTLRTVRDGAFYDDGVIRLEAARSKHLADKYGPASFSYRMTVGDKRVVFTGDLSADFSDFPDFAKSEPCDLCVCEMTHFPPEAALPTLMDSPISRLVFNHIHDPWHGDGEDTLRSIFADLPYQFHIAHDGDQFEVQTALGGPTS